MNQPAPQPAEQPQGQVAVFLNREKVPGDKCPSLEGFICMPGSKDRRPLALWAHAFTNPKTGEEQIMFNGRAGTTMASTVTPGMSAAQQLTALTQPAARATASDGPVLTYGNLQIAPNQIVAFPNGFKDEAPEKRRPDQWGLYNPGDGSPLVKVSFWMGTDKNGHLYMNGNTAYPQPGKAEPEMEAAPVSHMPAPETSIAMPKGMPTTPGPAAVKSRAKREAGGRE